MGRRTGSRNATGGRTSPATAHFADVPDELLSWGMTSEVASAWRRPWAHEVAKIVERAAGRTLTVRDRERFLSRLEALCAEAIRAGRGDLLLGLDVVTAELLGVVVELPSGRTVGAEGVSFAEALVLRQSEGSDQGVERVMAARDMVRHVFPGATVRSVQQKAPSCDRCGSEGGALMYEMSFGANYCHACWSELTRSSAVPLNEAKKRRGAR